MELNVLLLPLLGGFLFLKIFYRSSYFIASQSASTFSFWLATAGLALLAIARLAIMACQYATRGPEAVAIPVLGILVVPLLGQMAFALLLFGLVEFIRWRRGLKVRIDWRAPVGTVLFALTIGTMFALWREFPSVLPKLFGIPIQAVWALFWSALIYSWTNWARRIRISLNSILLRGALLSLLYALILGVVAFYPDTTKQLWLEFSAPTIKQIASDELGTSILAVVIGPLFAITLNLVYPLAAVQSHLFTNRATNSLERLFYRITRRGKMVMLTVGDGKVYCGYIDWIPGNPGATEAFLEILPVFSGYRETESKRVRLPVSYAHFYKTLPSTEWVQFKKVLPIASIAAAGEFDPEHFDTFAKNAAASTLPTPEASGSTSSGKPLNVKVEPSKGAVIPRGPETEHGCESTKKKPA